MSKYSIISTLFDIIFLLTLFNATSTQISSQYHHTENSLQIAFFIGSPFRLQYLIFDILLTESLLNDVVYLASESLSCKIIDEPYITIYQNKILKGKHVEDFCAFHFMDQRIPKFNFILVPDSKSYWHLAFGLNIKDESFSVLHLLKKWDHINELRFHIIPSIANSGRIYFGELPFEESMKIKDCNKAVLRVTNNKWSIVLKSIELSGYKYTLKGKEMIIPLSTIHDETFVTLDFLNFIISHYFSPYINTGTCYYPNKNEIELACDREVIPGFEVIIFNIDDYRFELPWSSFFSDFTNSGMLMWKVKGDEKENQFEFGLNFLLRYSVEFNFERKDISFYDKRNKGVVITGNEGSIENDFSFSTRIIAMLNTLVWCIGIGMVLYAKVVLTKMVFWN